MTFDPALLGAVPTYLDRYVFAGGVMMWALVPTSLIALGLVLQSFIGLRRGAIFSRSAREQLERLARAGEMEELVKACQAYRGQALGRVVRSALEQDAPPDADREIDLVRSEIARLFRLPNWLVVIYNVAPYMGLLGTVLGLMQTFNQFTISPDPSMAQLSRGLYTAMTTTLWGLGIAVPAFLFYHYFRARLIRIEEDILPSAFSSVAQAMRLHRHAFPVIGGEVDRSVAQRTSGGTKVDPRAVTPTPEPPSRHSRTHGRHVHQEPPESSEGPTEDDRATEDLRLP